VSDPSTIRAFLQSEVEALEPFDFVVARPVEDPLHAIEIVRAEAGGLEVHVPGRPPVLPELPVPVRSALRDRGFASEDPANPMIAWVHPAADAEAATELALRVLREVFGEKPGASLDFVHGSHRAEHEAELKLGEVRKHVERVLREMVGGAVERDPDGDYVLALGDVHVTVAPRAAPGGPAVVRVFAVTNVGVQVTPELGLFLARLNFGLMFGRFALDTDHHSIWFDETLLGEHFGEGELRFMIEMVARTADAWDDRLKQMFGGFTYQEFLKEHRGEPAPPTKPGMGGYL
jgi:hypothetical protein